MRTRNTTKSKGIPVMSTSVPSSCGTISPAYSWRQSLERIFVAVCIICAVVLSGYMLVMRFAHLTNGFQYDELYSAITASPHLSFSFIWKQMILQDVNLPLFNIILFGWNRIFPYTYFWMHFFSTLLGTAAVVAAWLLAPA